RSARPRPHLSPDGPLHLGTHPWPVTVCIRCGSSVESALRFAAQFVHQNSRQALRRASSELSRFAPVSCPNRQNSVDDRPQAVAVFIFNRVPSDKFSHGGPKSGISILRWKLL